MNKLLIIDIIKCIILFIIMSITILCLHGCIDEEITKADNRHWFEYRNKKILCEIKYQGYGTYDLINCNDKVPRINVTNIEIIDFIMKGEK
jgi:hypothetical protein